MDPTEVDLEAVRESKALGVEVNRSQMVKTLIAEALTTRQRRRNRKARE